MTQFEHLELLYNQYLNLSDEIHDLIKKEEYFNAVAKLENKDNLIRKILIARKTVNLTDEELQKAQLLEQKINKNEQDALISLKELQSKVGEELISTGKKIKMNNAYIIKSEEEHGAIADISE